jgi:hypothetical protein
MEMYSSGTSSFTLSRIAKMGCEAGPKDNLMTSIVGLEILKKWKQAGTVLLVPSASFKGRTQIFEAHVKILSVDESTLVLTPVDAADDDATFDICGAEFAETPMDGVELTFKGTTPKLTMLPKGKNES